MHLVSYVTTLLIIGIRGNNQVLSTDPDLGPPVPVLTLFDYEAGTTPKVDKGWSSGKYTSNVPNPSPNAINSSPFCAKYERSAASQWDSIIYSPIPNDDTFSDVGPYSSEHLLLYMDVYTTAEIGSEISLRFENSSMTSGCSWPCGRHSQYIAHTSKQNEWERIHIAFRARFTNASPLVRDDWTSQILLQVSHGDFSGDTYYLDNFVVYRTATAHPTISSMPSTSPSLSPTTGLILSDASSEKVVIPDPPTPEDILEGDQRYNCPHEPQDGITPWGDVVSNADGSDVTLPPSSKILISDRIPGVYGIVTIPATTELILGENLLSGVSLDVAGLEVYGTLTAGSSTCRLEGSVTITLHGSRPATPSSVPKSYKGISVDGGLISLHGKRYYRTWTRLARFARRGDSHILLQHGVNWEVGQEILVVTTALKDSKEWHQNERHVIASIDHDPSWDNVGAIVYLQESLEYDHIANSGYQGEVALLSRNIVIQGADGDSEPTDPDPLDCETGGYWYYGNKGIPCPDKDLTGYGGHVIVHSGGVGMVEGVEFHRMGQTNLLGKYPMHFHLLQDCSSCYLRHSSIHRSYYRCVSIHGTHNTTISENVAYDVTGYCYYLEDGVEEDNTLEFNFVGLVNIIGALPETSGQRSNIAVEGPDLLLPADVTASGFYITNVHNNIVGNAASGGWSGFAFPSLPRPVGLHKNENKKPVNALGLLLDGNTAHSSGWWWSHAGTFYFGGTLYYDDVTGVLSYNAGRDTSKGARNGCLVDQCTTSSGNCDGWCSEHLMAWLTMSNTKVFLTPSVGLNSWSGRMNILGFEAHDVGLSAESLDGRGFWINDMLTVCRTGDPWAMPPGGRSTYAYGNGFVWYDTGQMHIITNTTFRNCGYLSEEFDQYDTSPTRGCKDDYERGCDSRSSVFGFLTHADQFTPELMQGTKNIKYEDCGRRFRFSSSDNTISARQQNWLDVDGSASGLGEPALMGSGRSEAGLWWNVDDDVFHDEQAPLVFIKMSGGKQRHLGHIHLHWDDALHAQVGKTICGNGSRDPCPAVGYIKHIGEKYATDNGLPVTANPDIVGPTGGYGWLLTLNDGAPVNLKITQMEVEPDIPLMFSVAYPLGTSVTVTAKAAWCTNGPRYTCEEVFQAVPSVTEVRKSLGNTYHFDASTGLLTVRVVMAPKDFVGSPDWELWNWDSVGKWGGGLALYNFERDGVRLPKGEVYPLIEIIADCPHDPTSPFCSSPANHNPTTPIPVCTIAGYTQTSYDKCCDSHLQSCEFAGGLMESMSSSPSALPSMNPTMIQSSMPTSIPSDNPTRSEECVDTKGKFKISRRNWTCKKVSRNKGKNCSILQAAKKCPVTCGICNCEDSNKSFKIFGKMKNCVWVGNHRRTEKVCRKPNITRFCPVSCNACDPTPTA